MHALDVSADRIQWGPPLRDPAGPMTTCLHGGSWAARCPRGGTACPKGSFGCRLRVDDTTASSDRASCATTELTETDRPPTLRELEGRILRYFLTLTMVDAHRELTVKELAERLAHRGCGVAGRTSKVVSDSLRWEIRRGRVVRLRRGVYAAGRIPRQTEAWMRARVDEAFQRPPRPVRSWPVGGWRVGWNATARGRELAEAKSRRRAFRQAARDEAFLVKARTPGRKVGESPSWLRTWWASGPASRALPPIGVRRPATGASQRRAADDLHSHASDRIHSGDG